jgi:hypothetical protein
LIVETPGNLVSATAGARNITTFLLLAPRQVRKERKIPDELSCFALDSRLVDRAAEVASPNGRRKLQRRWQITFN